MTKLTASKITEIITSSAALRCRFTLQPAGGEGDKVFPPTYLDAKYACEDRTVVVDGEAKSVPCVLLDSVQSQANRMEDALQDALDYGKIQLPIVAVDFSDVTLIDPIGKITSLQAPHRIADAILRDSEFQGVPFRKSELGKQIDNVSIRNATPLFSLCPTALVFGVWDSTGPKGGLGAKFARALVSEIIGYDVKPGVKTGSRIDPLQIRAGAKVKINKKDSTWTLAKAGAKDGKSPSEVNHGNIPPTIDSNAGGVTVSRAEQTTVISVPALRKLKFPIDGQYKVEYDHAAQAVLLSLGLVAVTLAAESGQDLRSRCLLWPSEAPTWELLGKPGTDTEKFEISADEAISLYEAAVISAVDVGLPYNTDPIELTPGKQLVELLQRSQEIAASVGSEGNE